MGMSLAYAAEEGLRDIRPIIEEPSYVFWGWGLFVVILGIAGYFLWLRLNQKNKKVVEVDPQAVAIEALLLLEKEKDVKKAYVRLSIILRTYIEKTLEINALEMTMPELSKAIKSSSRIDEVWQGQLLDLCERMDVVAFAPEQGVDTSIVDDIDLVKCFVRHVGENSILS